MNVTSKNETSKKIEKENNNIVLSDQDKSVFSDVNAPFSKILSKGLEEISDKDKCADFFCDVMTLNLSEAQFFIDLTREGQFIVTQTDEGNFQTLIKTEIAQTTAMQKTVEVTNKITEMLEKAQSTQKPVRISFDNDVSVILKVDKHGKLTAEFIPGNVEVENYLRNNIASLRQKFDEQNLPYNDLLYRQNDRQNRRQQKDKGEK